MKLIRRRLKENELVALGAFFGLSALAMAVDTDIFCYYVWLLSWTLSCIVLISAVPFYLLVFPITVFARALRHFLGKAPTISGRKATCALAVAEALWFLNAYVYTNAIRRLIMNFALFAFGGFVIVPPFYYGTLSAVPLQYNYMFLIPFYALFFYVPALEGFPAMRKRLMRTLVATASGKDNLLAVASSTSPFRDAANRLLGEEEIAGAQ